ncbi:MAG: tetratricopeptide repeat protein, partial [Thermoanaerobaculia bacterium]
MIERHYDDEALISLLEPTRAAADAHLMSCTPCSEKVESFRILADALHDADVWDKREVRTDAVPATIATLRAFADRMAHEDTLAQSILTDLLAGPRETWMPRLQEHPEWRTAGVVRGLIAAAYNSVVTMPPDAVAITALAIDIAENLHPSDYPSDTVVRLRGAAWRDRAYALYYTGAFADAETALRVSERHLSSCVVDEYDLARVGIVKALVDRAFERFGEATRTAAGSSKAFVRFGDVERMYSAKLAEVHMLFSVRDFQGAEAILLDLDGRLSESEYAGTHSRVLGNLAYCYRMMGRLDLAVQYYDLATVVFEDLGIPAEAVRARWSAAAMLASAGRVVDALTRLESVVSEFDRLSMASEATLARLDVAELLLTQRRYAEVEQLCRIAMRSFEAAGLSYTSRVMTALAFMQEAAQQRTADVALVQSVKEYIRRVP